jgi:hypothetical protein
MEYFSDGWVILESFRLHFKIPLNPPEAVKKLVPCCFTSFRRKPESGVFSRLQILWTPVFTGETNKA